MAKKLSVAAKKQRNLFLKRGAAFLAIIGAGFTINYCANQRNTNQIIDVVHSSHAQTDSTIIAKTDNIIVKTDNIQSSVNDVNANLDSIDYKMDTLQLTADSIYSQTKTNANKIDSVYTAVENHDADMKKDYERMNNVLNSIDNMHSSEKKSSSPKQSLADQKRKLLNDLVSTKEFNKAFSPTDNGECLEDDLYYSNWGEEFSLKPLQETSYMRAFEAEQKALQNKYWFHKKN